MDPLPDDPRLCLRRRRAMGWGWSRCRDGSAEPSRMAGCVKSYSRCGAACPDGRWVCRAKTGLTGWLEGNRYKGILIFTRCCRHARCADADGAASSQIAEEPRRVMIRPPLLFRCDGRKFPHRQRRWHGDCRLLAKPFRLSCWVNGFNRRKGLRYSRSGPATSHHRWVLRANLNLKRRRWVRSNAASPGPGSGSQASLMSTGGLPTGSLTPRAESAAPSPGRLRSQGSMI